MRITLLGAVEAWPAGSQQRPVSLGGLRLRGLLARLALDAGRPVAVSELVDDLWGDASPEGAVNALQALVLRLRRAIGADLVDTAARGYRGDHLRTARPVQHGEGRRARRALAAAFPVRCHPCWNYWGRCTRSSPAPIQVRSSSSPPRTPIRGCAPSPADTGPDRGQRWPARRSAPHLRAAHELFAATGDRFGLGIVVHALGELEDIAGEHEAAARAYDEAIALAADLGNDDDLPQFMTKRRCSRPGAVTSPRHGRCCSGQAPWRADRSARRGSCRYQAFDRMTESMTVTLRRAADTPPTPR